jgi:glutathione S-transferase
MSQQNFLALPTILGASAVGVAIGWYLHGAKFSRPHVRLTYLDIKGIAEPIRLALFVGGIDFEDVRVGYEEVAALRESGKLAPFGQVPLLEIDGVPYTQSNALLRWAGSQCNLYPEALRLRCDMVDEALGDIKAVLRPQWYGHILGRSPVTAQPIVPMTEEQKTLTAQLLSTEVFRSHRVPTLVSHSSLLTQVLPTRFMQLEGLLGSDAYFCGSQLTICDLSFYVMATGFLDGSFCQGLLPSAKEGLLDHCPGLARLVERIATHSRVAEWNAMHQP